MSLLCIILLASLLQLTGTYELKAKYDASNFFDSTSFQFYDGFDNFTGGLALYIPKDEATSLGLANITDDQKVYLGVDTLSTLASPTPGEGNGRMSVRLEGVETFDSGLFVADFDHLPGNACGQWPAFWLLHDDIDEEAWYSEIDIVEGVSLQAWNQLTLYTMPDTCTMTDNGGSGTLRTLDCQLTGDESGCGVDAPNGTFGDAFNDHNGGVWATQVEADGVKAWYFERGQEPSDINSDSPDPSKWGTAVMDFAPDNCDVETAFKKMKIIINISFCGSYAGDPAWASYTQCAQQTGVATCNEYVAENPGAFTDVYYLINSVRVYQKTAESTLGSRSSMGEENKPIPIGGRARPGSMVAR